MSTERNGHKPKVKIVWNEGNQVHSVLATQDGEEDGFLRFVLLSGKQIRLSKTCILKIEEVSP
jgi:hypothetical protein